MATEKTPEVLFKENTRLVHFIALRYKTSANAPYYEDYLQEGMLGLWRACKTFDESKGYKFATYASRCVINQILMYFRKNNRHTSKNVISYDSTIINSNGDTAPLKEFLPDPHSLEEFESVEDRLSLSEECLSVLRENERDVLYRVYFLDQKQSDVAEALGCSQSYVSRLQKSALNKLRKAVGL